jgi:hypothetical protein
MVNEQLVLFQRRASKTQIRKFLGSFSYKFLRCASLQMTNPQIFLMNLQFRKFLQNCTTLFQNCPKNRLCKLFTLYKFELQHYMIYCICKEKKYVFVEFFCGFKSTSNKKAGSANRKSASATFAEGPQIKTI